MVDCSLEPVKRLTWVQDVMGETGHHHHSGSHRWIRELCVPAWSVADRTNQIFYDISATTGGLVCLLSLDRSIYAHLRLLSSFGAEPSS